MTFKLGQVGKVFTTRKDAQCVLAQIGVSGLAPEQLDFTGVEVANHAFTDELWKGLQFKYGPSVLSTVKTTGTNSHVKSCLAAGLSTTLHG